MSEAWRVLCDATGILANLDRILSVPVAPSQTHSEISLNTAGWAASGNDCQWAVSMDHYSIDSLEAAW